MSVVGIADSLLRGIFGCCRISLPDMEGSTYDLVALNRCGSLSPVKLGGMH